jgi:phosphate transport system permease protein
VSAVTGSEYGGGAFGPGGRQLPDPAHALSPSGNLRRRLVISRVLQVLMTLCAAIAVVMLAILVVYVAIKGIGAFSFGFLVQDLPPPSGITGGMGPALLGTIELVAIATVIAVPVGVATAIAVNEYAGPRLGGFVRMFLDLMNGLPTVVTGVFIWALFAEKNSAIQASLALAIVMTPLIARASIESINRVPESWREAADALGVARWRSVLGVILPGALSGITTATILAIARAAGETAPVLFNDSLYGPGVQLNPLHAVPNIPVEILELLEQGFSDSVNKAWGMAFVLVFMILLMNIGARLLLRRGQRKRGL